VYAKEMKGATRQGHGEDWGQLRTAYQYRTAEEAYRKKNAGLWGSGLSLLATDQTAQQWVLIWYWFMKSWGQRQRQQV
jgi:hypothetical protein